jgi:hypothetical protein
MLKIEESGRQAPVIRTIGHCFSSMVIIDAAESGKFIPDPEDPVGFKSR